MVVNTKINSRVDNAIDKIATEAEEERDQALASSLWDRCFVSFAPEMVVRLPYYYQDHENVASGALGSTNQFKVNSCYDFDLSGVGHQPSGFDTWATIYDYYKVLETRIHVRVTSSQYVTGVIQAPSNNLMDGNAGPSYMAPTYIGGMLDITANPPSSLTTWQHASIITGNSQQRFTPVQILERIGSRKNTTVYYDMTWTPAMFDTAILNQATQNTWTPVGSDPANLNYFSNLVYNSNSGNNNVFFSVEVKAEFLVAFKNVKRTLLQTLN